MNREGRTPLWREYKTRFWLRQDTDMAEFVRLTQHLQETPMITIEAAALGHEHAALIQAAAKRFGELILHIPFDCRPTEAWGFLRDVRVPLYVRVESARMAEVLPPTARVQVYFRDDVIAALRAPMFLCAVSRSAQLGANLNELRCLHLSTKEPRVIEWAAAHPCLEELWLSGLVADIDPLVRANRLRNLTAPRCTLRVPMLLADNRALKHLECEGDLGDAVFFNCTLESFWVGGHSATGRSHAAYRLCADAALVAAGLARRVLGRDACRLVARAVRATLADSEWRNQKRWRG
jgi:hypothetical protein